MSSRLSLTVGFERHLKGKQNWDEVYKGQITNGGINDGPD
jgi:hypothetical protein